MPTDPFAPYLALHPKNQVWWYTNRARQAAPLRRALLPDSFVKVHKPRATKCEASLLAAGRHRTSRQGVVAW